jgi:hypothetical protein
MKAERIWRLNNRDTVIEHMIEKLKNDFAATATLPRKFWANGALFIMGLVAYNLLNCIRRF